MAKSKRKTYKEIAPILEQSYLYKKEMEEIETQYHFADKRDFIDASKVLQKEDAFLSEFRNTFSCLFNKVYETDSMFEFETFLTNNGVDVDSMSYHYALQYSSTDKCFSLFYEHSIGWDTEKVYICDIDWSIDLYELMKKMEVYSQSLTEKLQEIARRKKERERIEEERKAREEYKLYLKLKEKYEGKDT